MFNFLYTAVSFVLLLWHRLFSAMGVDKDSGLNWGLSIVFLVITARVLLFRLFIKQVHYQRHMQEMQPKIQKLREKYKDDKQEMQRQMMKLQQEEGFNPLSGCLPMFLQLPVFWSLFHVLRHLAAAASTSYQKAHADRLTLYGFHKDETLSAARARLFGAPMAASFHDSTKFIEQLGGHAGTTRIVLVILLVISSAATMGTQLLVRSSQTTVPEGTAALVQKFALYVIPLGVLGSGLLFNFPLGVVLYWFTSNLWTLAQQAYIVRFHPPTEADKTPVAREVGKALAPKPGAKPVRRGRGRPALGAKSASIDLTKNDGGSADAAGGAGSAAVNGSSDGGAAGRGDNGRSGADKSGGAKSGGAKSGGRQSGSNRQSGSKQSGTGQSGAGKAGAAQSGVGKSNSTESASGDVHGSDVNGSGGSSTAPAAGRTPRPGQRPARPGRGRPPAKRPSQAKKRR